MPLPVPATSRLVSAASMRRGDVAAARLGWDFCPNVPLAFNFLSSTLNVRMHMHNKLPSPLQINKIK